MLLGDDGKPLPMQKETNVTSVCGSSITMEMQWEDSDSDKVEDINDDMARYMPNPESCWWRN